MATTYNRTILIGRLGEKPELKTIKKSGKNTEYTEFRMCNSTFNNGVEQIQWHKILAFGKQARLITEQLNKGDMCCIEGSLDKKMYEEDGEKLYAIAVIAQRITFVPKRREQPQEQAEQSE